MPVYEYRCTACKARHEDVLPMGVPAPACPACGGELWWVYGWVGVWFLGWGFDWMDLLVPGDRPRKDFKKLREKADEIAEG